MPPLTATAATVLALIVIVVDDFGYSNPGFTTHRSKCTPYLDHLAQQGTVLETFYTFPTCTPSRAALLTSRVPTDYGLGSLMILRRTDYGLPLTEQLWSEAFAENNITAALFGKYHLGSFQQAYTPHRRGFAYSVGFYGSSLGYYDHIEQGGTDWYEQGVATGYPGPSVEAGRYSSDVIVEKLAKFLAGHKPTERVFLYLPLQVAHQPMEAPPGTFDGLCHQLNPEYPTASYIYNQMMGSLDATVETIITTLNTYGYTQENSLVAIIGDNGGIYSFGGDNYPLRGEKGQSYNGGVQVPALLWGRGVPRNRTYAHPMSVIDLIPTMVDGAGWLVPKNHSGKSLWHGLQWDQPVRYETLVQLDWCNSCPFDWTCSNPCECPRKAAEFPNAEVQAGLRVDKWKLIFQGLNAELYDLSVDPSERINVARGNTEVVSMMTERLLVYYRRAPEIAKPKCDPADQPVNGWWLPKDYGVGR